MDCPACGHSNRPEARFCDGCGRQLSATAPQAQAPSEPDARAWREELREAHRLFTEIGARGYAERIAEELPVSGS